MTPRPSFVGRLVHAPVLREDRKRRVLFAVLIAICAVLTFFPRTYRTAVSLTPSDPSTLGLSGTLGQLGAGANIFGNQAAIEVSLKIGRSVYVRDLVIRKLDLENKLGLSHIQAQRWLERWVDVRIMRGGIIEIELDSQNPELARSIVETYANAVREQLGIISRQQTAYKRKILEDLVENAAERLEKAQAAFDTFRISSRYGDPEEAIKDVAKKVPSLDEQVENKESELNAVRRFATDDNILVKRVKVELEELQRRRAIAMEAEGAQRGTVGQVVTESTKAFRLKRELDVAQSLYDNYKRFLQGTSVEDLTSTANIRILEPAYIDPDRQYNLPALALGLALLLLALAIEFYKLRPPVGDQRIGQS
ncbi:MAG: hypothetical protein KGQ75_16630 [Sphingomonadales bacterium]|nr:hypothetical protein [Sphingomonadales bacterium]